MPITSQNKKAIRLNKAGWRSEKHLRGFAKNNKGRTGITFFGSLDHACSVGLLESMTPGWGRGVVYYRLTKKGRRYLEKKDYSLVRLAFKLPEALKLSATRAQLQRQGWYSVKHTGRIDQKMVDDGVYESASFLRRKKHGTYYKLTKKGRLLAKERMKKAMEADLRSEFRQIRRDNLRVLNSQLKDPSYVVRYLAF